MSSRPVLIGGKRGVQERATETRELLTSHKSRITSRGISVGRISGGNALISSDSKSRSPIFKAGANERGKKRMRSKWLRFEFGMKLAANEPRMIGHFDNFDIHAIGRPAGDAESGARERLLVLAIKFVTMAMALRNFQRAVSLMRKRPGLEFAWPRTQPHRAAHLVDAQQFAQFVNHAIRGRRIEFRAVRIFNARNLPRVFDRRALHPKTNPKERDFLLARISNRLHHSRDAALAESARNENPISVAQQPVRRRRRINILRFDPFKNHALPVRKAAMNQRLAQTLIRILELHILPHHADVHFTL